MTKIYKPEEHVDCNLCKRIADEIEKIKKDVKLFEFQKAGLIRKYKRMKAKLMSNTSKRKEKDNSTT